MQLGFSQKGKIISAFPPHQPKISPAFFFFAPGPCTRLPTWTALTEISIEISLARTTFLPGSSIITKPTISHPKDSCRLRLQTRYVVDQYQDGLDIIPDGAIQEAGGGQSGTARIRQLSERYGVPDTLLLSSTERAEPSLRAFYIYEMLKEGHSPCSWLLEG